MPRTGYLNFDLRLEPWQGGYRARVVGSPVGDGAMAPLVAPPPGEAPGEGAREADLRAFGGRLFQAAFGGEVLGYLRRSQDEVQRQGADGLCLRLHLSDVPELAGLPWETLFDPAADQFLCLSTATPLVRYLDLPQPIRPLAVQAPLRILALLTSPSDQPRLDAEAEWTRLQEAVAGLQTRGQVELERMEAATLLALQRQIRQSQYHVLHYVGHGTFDEAAQEGMLILEDEAGLSRPVSGQMLGTLLLDERSLRLVVLNACEAGRAASSDPFAGVAQNLVRKGIPAVIAMQREISDQAAAKLAQEFYTVLAEGLPVDAALTEARRCLYLAGYELEWATPVLYLRAPDGRLFGLAAAGEPDRQSATAPPQVQAPQLPTTPAYAQRKRPVFGGDSLGHAHGSTATLSCLVIDRVDRDRLYLLSDTSGLCPPGARPGDPILQPGTADGGTFDDVVATLTRWVPLRDDPRAAATNLPAAIAEVLNQNDVSPQIHDIGGYLQGVHTALRGTPVFAAGRTMGVVRGEVLRTDAFQEVALSVDLFEGGLATTGDSTGLVRVLLAGLIETSIPLQAGDCGAILVDSENYALGIAFSQGPGGSLFLPMRGVLDALNVDLVTEDVWSALRAARRD
jgi:hypothetical protein